MSKLVRDIRVITRSYDVKLVTHTDISENNRGVNG